MIGLMTWTMITYYNNTGKMVECLYNDAVLTAQGDLPGQLSGSLAKIYTLFRTSLKQAYFGRCALPGNCDHSDLFAFITHASSVIVSYSCYL